MHRVCLLPVAIAATLLASCAPMDNKTASDEAISEKTHVTGSRLPVRDGTAANVESNANNGAWVPAGNVNVQPKGGH